MKGASDGTKPASPISAFLSASQPVSWLPLQNNTTMAGQPEVLDPRGGH